MMQLVSWLGDSWKVESRKFKGRTCAPFMFGFILWARKLARYGAGDH